MAVFSRLENQQEKKMKMRNILDWSQILGWFFPLLIKVPLNKGLKANALGPYFCETGGKQTFSLRTQGRPSGTFLTYLLLEKETASYLANLPV